MASRLSWPQPRPGSPQSRSQPPWGPPWHSWSLPNRSPTGGSHTKQSRYFLELYCVHTPRQNQADWEEAGVRWRGCDVTNLLMDQEWDKSGKYGYLRPSRWGQVTRPDTCWYRFYRFISNVKLSLHYEKNDPFAVVHFHILRSLASDVSYQAQSLVTMKGCRKVRLPSASKSANERSATEQSELFLRGKVIVQIMGLIRSDQWLASNFHVPPPPPHLSRRHQSLKLRFAPCEPSKGEI